MRREMRVRAWLASVALAALGAAALASSTNDLTLALSVALIVPLAYVAVLEFEDGWRGAHTRTRATVVLVAFAAVAALSLALGVDWYGAPVGGVWVQSWVTLALVVAALVAFLLDRRGRKRP